MDFQWDESRVRLEDTRIDHHEYVAILVLLGQFGPMGSSRYIRTYSSHVIMYLASCTVP